MHESLLFFLSFSFLYNMCNEGWLNAACWTWVIRGWTRWGGRKRRESRERERTRWDSADFAR